MEWIRGAEIGCGGFASINIAIPNEKVPGLPPMFAVKSCELSESASLRNELEVLTRLGDCPQVIRCFGASQTIEGRSELYNLFLEYAPGGSLASEMRKRGGKLMEAEVRQHARLVLAALRHVHSKGFVHGDIKVQNILVFPQVDGYGVPDVKVADFGLAREAGYESEGGFEWRGTPLYMSPEAVNDNEYEAPSDVWAFGCAVVEMATGRAPWEDTNIYKLMIRIGVGEETPIIPHDLSEDGKDFLRKCFVKDPTKRWTADMLSNHPFVVADVKDCDFVSKQPHSPRTHFDLMDWDSFSSSPDTVSSSMESQQHRSKFGPFNDEDQSPAERIHNLAGEGIDNSEEAESLWITVR